MFEDRRYERRLRQIQEQRRKIGNRYKPLLEEARRQGVEARDSLMAEAISEFDELDEMVAEHRHSRTMELAERYDVPTKSWSSTLVKDDGDGDDTWQRSRFTRRWFITEAEAARLRSAIRQEKKERFEERSRYLPPFISILSLVVAILALLLKH